MKKTALITTLTLFSLPALSAPELKGSPQDLQSFLHPKTNIVTISDQAEETAYSDKAIITLVVTTENKRLSDAIASNTTLRNNITQSLIESGLSQQWIKNSKFSSSPQYGWFGSKPSSFEVVNRMAITIENEEHLQHIAMLSDQYEEVELSDTAFEHTKKEQFNEKVKAKALAKIIKQKEFYEQSLNVKLTPIGIRDFNLYRNATRGAQVLEENVIYAQKVAFDSSTSKNKEVSWTRQNTDSSFDELQYKANLSVDFKIEYTPK